MMKLRVVLFALLALILTTGAWAIGPDVIVGGLGEGGSSDHWKKYDIGGPIIAYSFSTTSCNVGTSNLPWTPGGLHPVIGQNIFRLQDGRFEQLGQAWLKHGFCALDQNFCGLGCSGTGCSSLGVGCSDPYTASRNAAFGLGPKHNVNAADGSHVHVGGTSGGSGINGRLQVRRNDMDPALNPGALYFAEGQYVHPSDAAAGNDDNNASYRRINVSASLNLSFPEPTFDTRRSPGIFAWDKFAGAKLAFVDIPNDGRLWVGYLVSDNGDGTWHYQYAVQNLNSDRSLGSFGLTMAKSIGRVISGVEFHDVDYHSGEIYDLGDWASSVGSSDMIWQTQQTFSQNPNANALRWGTLYNFGFDANAAPESGTATLGLFKPGTPGSDSLQVQVPSAPDPVPAAPDNVAAVNNNSCDEIDVSWDSAVDATGIEVYRNSVDDSGTAALIDSVAGTATSYVDTFVGENGSTWHYWVKACNGNGCSDFSSPSTSATLQVKGDFEPNGLFNGLDVNGFVVAALAGDACADLAAPFGTIDDADAAAMAGLLVP